jgi:hypothetical protein
MDKHQHSSSSVLRWRKLLVALSVFALLSLAGGFLFAYWQLTREDTGWSLDSSLPGAVAQLQIDYRLEDKSARVQIACGSRLLRSSGISVSNARKACRMIASSSADYRNALIGLDKSSAACPVSENALSRRVRGEVLGVKFDFYLPSSECPESVLTDNKIDALMQALTPAFPGQKPPSAPKNPSSNDPRPNKDRIFPCPAGVKNTVELPCLEN